MRYIIHAPKQISTTIHLPASKSISNRALILHALSGGTQQPQNLSVCDDTDVLVAALQNMPATIDVGAAGTAMRFLTAYLAATIGEHIITGSQRMLRRPIGELVDALRALGADIEYAGQEGYPPLHIKGHALNGGTLQINGDISSQYITALLLIAPTLRGGLQLQIMGEITSRPYIDLTLHVMHAYGIDAEWTDVDTISVKEQKIRDVDYRIESDWSAASYWYEILALLGDNESAVDLPGLCDSSRQGDSAVRYLYSLLGIKTSFSPSEEGICCAHLSTHRCTLHHMDYDFINQPDLAQTLVATCAALGMSFHFTGLASLHIKETDRIEALKTEMRKFGILLQDNKEDELCWNGERCEPLAHPAVDTYNDHRMAMAFAPLAIVRGSIAINDPQVVSKSYPEYWNNLRQAGFTITEE